MIEATVQSDEHYVLCGDANGTSRYYRHILGLLYSDGVKDFAKTHEAFWLIDVIASHIPSIPDYDGFYVFYCNVQDGQAVIFGQRDSGEPITVFQQLEYTDLTVSTKFWYEHGVLISPIEH
jgi:hypothetical protein